MLSTQYRLRLEAICERIATGESVELSEMIWAEKLAKANRSAATILRQARRRAANPDMTEDSLDGLYECSWILGDPDPSNHRTRFDSADDIIDFFTGDKPEDWRQRD
jgi:hypothetical protein